MIFRESDLSSAEARLCVRLPTSFKNFVLSRDLASFVSWHVLHPSEWWPVRHDEAYTLEPGIVFAEHFGVYYLLRETASIPQRLDAAIWSWDAHTPRHCTRVASSVDELPEVLERLADELLGS